MSKKVLEGVILAYANLTLAICYPILALLRLLGIAFYELIVLLFYILSYPANVSLTKWKWGVMSYEDFSCKMDEINFADVKDHYKWIFRKYILRKENKKKSIRVEE